MTSARLFIAFLLTTVGLGWALTIWLLIDGLWRLIQRIRSSEG